MRNEAWPGSLGLAVAALAIALLGSPPRSASLAFLGDIMLGRGVAQSHADQEWSQALAYLALQSARADLAIANLESPLTLASLQSEGFDLRASPASASAMRSAGIDLVSLANNHSLDAGLGGLRDTVRSLGDVGIHSLEPETSPWLTEVRGIRIAWIALDDVSRPLQASHIHEALSSEPGAHDLLIISIHWGIEYEVVPNPRQRDLAAELASAGADLVIGHHPHITQSVEWIWGRGRARPTLVAFSLGNALFDQGAPPGARQSIMLMVRVSSTGASQFCLIPFQIDPRTWNAVAPSPTSRDAIRGRLGAGSECL